MSWYSPPKYERPDLVDFNEELKQMHGELDEKTARITLAKFFRRNIGIATEKLTGIKLATYQILTIKGMLNRNNSLCIWGRGVGKTFTAAIYCILQCVFEPGTNILICGPTFRTARFIFTHIENIVERPEAKLLFDCMGIKVRRNDEFRWSINGGSIIAIPLNGEKIRGFRANVLVIDEFLLMSEDMVEKVLTPYLVAPKDIGQRIKIRAKEDDLIREGKMTEDERMVFEDENKMICLSSASYKCEYLYRKCDTFLRQIYAKEEKQHTGSFFVSQLAWDAIPSEMMDKSIIELARSEEANSANFAREYCAQFIDGSDSYFSMNKMIACTVPDGQDPHLLVKGTKDRKYLMAIDPNFSNSPTADHFAMCVIELDDDLKGGTVVHQYAKAGKDLKDHIKYFYYLLKSFNPEMIVIDYAGYQFIEAANENELFVKDKINLKIFDFVSEKDGAEYEEELKKAKREYNKTHQKIVFTQYFTSDFIRKGNEWLQGCIDYKKIWFASKIKCAGCEPAFNQATSANLDLSLLGLAKEGEVKGETINDFIDEQEYLISNVKNECANIEVKTTAKGTQSFDLPLIMRRDNSSDRNRRDSYTALMLACWGMKCYLEIRSLPEEDKETFVPFFL
jgi:hypothetical protein